MSTLSCIWLESYIEILFQLIAVNSSLVPTNSSITTNSFIKALICLWEPNFDKETSIGEERQIGCSISELKYHNIFLSQCSTLSHCSSNTVLYGIRLYLLLKEGSGGGWNPTKSMFSADLTPGEGGRDLLQKTCFHPYWEWLKWCA